MTPHAYSTLAFVTEHARRHDVFPIITFDQPLWWKALVITRSEPLVSDLRRIVLLLSGFHAETSSLVVSDTSWLHLDYSNSCSRYTPNAVDAALNAMMLKPQAHQAYGQVTTYLRPNNGAIVEITNDWSQRSWVVARCKSVAARSWSCSKPSHTGLTIKLRPTCDRKMLQSWAN